MPDLSADEFTIPNPFGLRAADFDFAMESYRAALGFLGDLATGTDEGEALTSNGGDPGMLVGWRKSPRFRRVYAKCKAAGADENALLAAQEPAGDDADASEANPPGQQFVSLEDTPATLSPFRLGPGRDSWGHA